MRILCSRAAVLCAVLCVFSSADAFSAAARRRIVRPDPPHPVDLQARDVAQLLRGGGEGAYEEFLSALQTAGIGVINGNGTLVVVPADPPQGLALRDSYARDVMESFENGFQITLADLSSSLEAVTGEFAARPIEPFILEGIRTQAYSNRPTLRFWARLIIELGRTSGEPYDLLGTVDSSAVTLDSVQVALILHRLAGDFYAFATAHGKTGSLMLAPQASRPCALGETGNLILDAAAVGLGKAFGALLDYLEEVSVVPENVGKVQSAVSAVLSYAEILMALLSFKAEVTLEGGEPLVRTKTRSPGEQRQLRGRAWMDTGNSQVMNCLRPVLNLAGLDFSVDENGPVKDAKVQWVLMDHGGLRRGPSGGAGALDAIVRFYGGNPALETTNSEGISTIGIEGAPQKQDLANTVVPVTKRVTVRMNVQLQSADILTDTINAVDKVGDLAALLSLPAELLRRTRWLFGGSGTFDVKDWAGDRAEFHMVGRVIFPDTTVTRTLEGTVALESVGDAERGRVGGRGRISWIDAYVGAINGQFVVRTILEVEGEYSTPRQEITFNRIRLFVQGASGSYTDGESTCTASGYWLYCVIPGHPGVRAHILYTEYDLLEEPLRLRMIDGERVPLPDNFGYTQWNGSVTLRFGD